MLDNLKENIIFTLLHDNIDLKEDKANNIANKCINIIKKELKND